MANSISREGGSLFNLKKRIYSFSSETPILFKIDLKFPKNFTKIFATLIPESFPEISTNFSENVVKILKFSQNIDFDDFLLYFFTFLINVPYTPWLGRGTMKFLDG